MNDRAKYTEDSETERKSKGFELVRVHHQTLTRMFCEDPDGECFDIDDIRCVWEEFVDALRDASAKAGDPRPKDTSTSYADVEQPALQRSPSFARLVENLSSEASGASTPGTPTIDLVSRHGMILGVGCSSRDNSAPGGIRVLSQDARRQGEARRRRARGAAPQEGPREDSLR